MRKGPHSDIKHDLEFYPALRERKNKNRYIAVKLERKYKTGISVEKMMDIIFDAVTMDRGWRYILQHYPKLRGSDYGDKKVLEQSKKVELGYEGGPDVSEFKDLIDSF